MIKKILILAIFIVSFLDAKYTDYSKNSEVKKFINKVVSKGVYTKDELNKLFSQVEVQNFSLKFYTKKVKKDFEVKGDFIGSWDKYEKKILNKKRIELGIDFMRENISYLKKAQKKYGVPASYITSIIGVETFYGSYMGNQKVFDTLVTLAFEKNRRNRFFKKELEHFLQFSKKSKINLDKQKGSFAGAFGLSQFMPSSFKSYAVDFDKDGKIDLNNSADAIGSVANYLKKVGWNKNIPVATRVSYKGMRFNRFKTGTSFKYKRSRLLGIKPKSKNFFYNDKVFLLKLSRKKYDELWYGTKNFKVIKRYNNSTYYAMAVHHLAKKIRVGYKSNL